MGAGVALVVACWGSAIARRKAQLREPCGQIATQTHRRRLIRDWMAMAFRMPAGARSTATHLTPPHRQAQAAARQAASSRRRRTANKRSS